MFLSFTSRSFRTHMITSKGGAWWGADQLDAGLPHVLKSVFRIYFPPFLYNIRYTYIVFIYAASAFVIAASTPAKRSASVTRTK
jgi:hypothetical protein